MTTTSPPSIGSIITNPTARKVIYSIYGLGVIIIGALQVAFSASGSAQPSWLTITLAVSAYLGVLVAGLATANAGNTSVVTNYISGTSTIGVGSGIPTIPAATQE